MRPHACNRIDICDVEILGMGSGQSCMRRSIAWASTVNIICICDEQGSSLIITLHQVCRVNV